ncbi:MAG TPA: hypothetical protein VK978_01170 [Candidatus Saccharimonadales bacterium]|nr:hypothetical protein [Candidatus Saccharimonadales bacterium]
MNSSSGISERFVAAAAATGVALGTLTACSQSEPYPAAYEGFLQPLDVSKEGVLISAEMTSNGLEPEYDPAFPAEYQGAFSVALQHPIVGLAAEQGYVAEAEVRVAARDEASYEPEGMRLVFEVSEAREHEERMYIHSTSVAAIAVHEAVHGITMPWYEAYESERLTGDADRDSNLTQLRQACAGMGEQLQRSFITKNRQDIADTYTELAATFDAVPPNAILAATYGVERLSGHADGFRDAAEAVQSNDPALYPESDGSSCQPSYVTTLPYLAAGNNAAELNGYEQVVSQSEALQRLQQTMDAEINAGFACIDDGAAINDLLGLQHESPVGHPQDNVSEATSSIISILDSHPRYLADCYQGMADNPNKKALFDLVHAILDITAYEHPELIALLEQDAGAAEVVDLFS